LSASKEPTQRRQPRPGSGLLAGFADPDAAAADTLDDRQPVALHDMRLTGAQEGIAGFVGNSDPDRSGGAGDTKATRATQADRAIVGEADFP